MSFRKKSTKELVRSGAEDDAQEEKENILERRRNRREKGGGEAVYDDKLAFFKTRLFLGLLCTALGIAVAAVAVPILRSQTTDTVNVVVFAYDVSAGSLLTANDLQTVEVSSYHLPAGTVFDASFAVGKYLRAEAMAGDYVTQQRLSLSYPGDDPYLLNLPEGKMAISVSLPELSQSVSGKLRSGDVIQLFAVSEEDDDVRVADAPLELQYVEVLTATYQSGVDVKDGDYAKNSEDLNDNTLVTATILVNPRQAAVVAGLQRQSVLYAALVIRGNDARKDAALKAQDDYFTELAAAEAAAAAAAELEEQQRGSVDNAQPEDLTAETPADATSAEAAPVAVPAEGGE